MKQIEFSTRPLRYQSYVVRCWEERTFHGGKETTVWRFSIQDPSTDWQRGFATLEALLSSLQAKLNDEDSD